MPTIHRSAFVRITLPDDVVITNPPAGAAAPPPVMTRRLPGFRPIPMPAAVGGDETTRAILDSLAAQEIGVMDELQLQPAPPPAGRAVRTLAAGVAAAQVGIEVDLAAGESAVVLVEQDGLFAWRFPDSVEERATTPMPGMRGVPQSQQRVRFTVPLAAAAPPAGAGRRGFISDLLFAQARAWVLKFAARIAVGQVMTFLERNVQRGLVVLDGDDPSRWPRVRDAAQFPMPSDRAARVLLFIHGTFSSTVGSYGGLTATPWGREFLRAARANYDLVIGFDHATLSEDPLANAADLLRRLEAGAWAQPPRVDVVCYSRGGLVFRSLVEHLLPNVAQPARFDRAVFVGVVNSGTLLGAPDNWHTLLDLYTNLAAAAGRGLALFPQTAVAGVVLREAVSGIAAFAKFLATQTLTEGAIPGLAAMNPDGPFVAELNRTQPGQPVPAQTRWFAITSNFAPKLALAQAKDLPKQLVQLLADGLMDQLMGEANDLVVNTASMTAIDPGTGGFVKDTLAFGQNGVVFHLNYFVQPQTVDALTRWLELAAPQFASPAALRGVSPAGATAATSLSARVDRDVLLAEADEAVADVVKRIEERAPSFVTVTRWDRGQRLHYAFKSEEVLRAAGHGGTMLSALNLNETDASPSGSAAVLPVPDLSSGSPSRRRGVVLEGNMPVGVLPDSVQPQSLDDLVVLAQQLAAPKSVEDSIHRTRSLPTFAAAQGMAAPRPRREPSVGMSAPPAVPVPKRMADENIVLANSVEVPTPDSFPGDNQTRFVTPEKPQPSKVACEFFAQMDEEIELTKTASIEVTLSREEIQRAIGVTAAHGRSGEVDPSRNLIVMLAPKLNLRAVGETRHEIAPPPGEPQTLYFDVEPVEEGAAEVWIVIRQGAWPLAQLMMHPRVVRRRAAVVRRALAPAKVIEGPTPSAPPHQLSIFERFAGGELTYQFIFDSPTLGLKHVYESKPIRQSREAYVDQLYQQLEERWVSSNQDAADFQAELRAFGAQLWDALLPVDLQQTLWTHRDQIESVMVFSEEPFIPWELLHFKQPGQPLGAETLFLGQRGLVRWLHNMGWPPEVLRFREGRCRYAIPNYPHPNHALPQAQLEIGFLTQRFHATPVTPQPREVRDLLAAGGAFDLFHFAGHGDASHEGIANAQLLLQGRIENGNYLPAMLSATTVEQFAELRGADGSNRPVIVLNACRAGRQGYQLTSIGGFARAFLQRGAGMFVGALWSVGDAPARTFTETLYERLLAGDTLAAAVSAGREASRQAGDATWMAYAVYGHPLAKAVR